MCSESQWLHYATGVEGDFMDVMEAKVMWQKKEANISNLQLDVDFDYKAKNSSLRLLMHLFDDVMARNTMRFPYFPF